MQYETDHARYTARMEANGRIVIPARVREALGLVAGSQLTLLVDGDTLLVRAKPSRIRQVREQLRAYRADRHLAGGPEGQVVDAFLTERRNAEAERERRLDALFPHRTQRPAPSPAAEAPSDR